MKYATELRRERDEANRKIAIAEDYRREGLAQNERLIADVASLRAELAALKAKGGAEPIGYSVAFPPFATASGARDAARRLGGIAVALVPLSAEPAEKNYSADPRYLTALAQATKDQADPERRNAEPAETGEVKS